MTGIQMLFTVTIAIVAHQIEAFRGQGNQLDPYDQEVGMRFISQTNQNGLGLFNRNPWVALASRLPIIRNPEFTGLLATYDSCTAPDGESGVCLTSAGCTLLGGRASGSCVIGTVCCINVVSRCSGTISLNNTYWQVPSTGVSPSSTCSVTVRLDQNLPEQKKYPICQLRLDIISFTIAQPDDASTVCKTDSFQVSGASSQAPTICGDNDGQHMYLNVPPSNQKTSDVQLTFTFGTTLSTRSWNIKIAMIPCGATYAAPSDCLQYYTSSVGTVKSFNWKDTPTAGGTRQLANQDYYICLRTELVSNKLRANGICYQVCTVTNGGNPFFLTGTSARAEVSKYDCQNDFLVIPGAADSGDTAALRNDRYCGGFLNPQLGANAAASTVANAATTSIQVCSSITSFRLYYRTNGDETQLADPDGGAGALVQPEADAKNSGFCLNFMQRLQ